MTKGEATGCLLFEGSWTSKENHQCQTSLKDLSRWLVAALTEEEEDQDGSCSVTSLVF